jgi:hypothetical protein
MPPDPVYRVVDRENQGWHPVGRAGSTAYAADFGSQRDLPDVPYAELFAARAPLRPVENVTPADVEQLRDLFTEAGRKTVTTLAAALGTVLRRLAEERSGAGHRDSWEYARRTLIAGREGSWESQVLTDVALFGKELAPKRVHPAVQERMAAMFWRWVTGPGRYTEVAETLASVVSSYCDQQETGWKAVADQWLQPGGLAQADFSTCYRLLYSHSEHFDTEVI